MSHQRQISLRAVLIGVTCCCMAFASLGAGQRWILATTFVSGYVVMSVGAVQNKSRLRWLGIAMLISVAIGAVARAPHR